MAQPTRENGHYSSSNPYHAASPLHASPNYYNQPSPNSYSRPLGYTTNHPRTSAAGAHDLTRESTSTRVGSGAPGSEAGMSETSSRQDSVGLSGTRIRIKTQQYDELDDDELFGDDEPESSNTKVKTKTTRGSRACTVCRKLKMRCVGAEIEAPCNRCKSGNHECLFEESQRGRRSGKKSEVLAKSLKKMEATLETVLQSIAHPGASIAAGAGMIDDYSPETQQSESPAGLNDSRVPGGMGMAGDHQDQHALAGPSDEGVRFESGLGRQGMQWNAWDQPEERPRLHSLPSNTLNPLGLLAEASLQNSRKRMLPQPHPLSGSIHPESDHHHDDRDTKKTKLGVANHSYFQPGPMNILPLRRIVIEQRMPPALLVEKIVTIDEVVELFALFFSHCHRGAPFLDPAMHTPTATGSRSPFLFTCICAVAARYYTKRTDDLYRKCLATAKKIAFDVMARGFKSVEIVQGFLLLCHWNQPAERFEEDRTWSFSGAAFRMATDLNLHRKTIPNLPEDVSEETRVLYEREILNRERCWYYCFICDSSLSAQLGKPSSIAKEDFIIRNGKNWYKQRGSIKSDVGLSAMVEMHRIVSRMLDTLYSDTRTISGLNVHLDYPLVMRGFLSQLDQWRQEWTENILVDIDDPGDVLRFKMREFYAAYYRLFLLSFAVQHALDTPDQAINLPSYCMLSFESASSLIKIACEYLGPHGVLRFGIDSTYVYLSYAATFLLKLISPAFARFVDESLVIALVRDLAAVLESCAVDDSHTPALYASFLRSLIESKLAGGRTAPASRAGTRPSSPIVHQHTTGLESFVRSRANSVGLEEESRAAGLHSEDSAQYAMSSHNTAMDNMLNGSGFWDNMLMPGFASSVTGGGPSQGHGLGGFSFGGLSGGGGVMLSGEVDPWSMSMSSATPFHSRPPSPGLSQFPVDFPTPH